MRIDNKLFNPASQPKELLIENFVVRTKVFEKIFKDIQSGEMKYPEQHYLIQGLRGMGKTTLLLRLKYEVEKNEGLNSWLIPVFFNEESYDLSSLSNLWEKLLKYLDDYFETGSTLYDSTEKFMGSKEYEKQCLDLLLQTLQERKKKLLILFDNFGELFLMKKKRTAYGRY
jgi:predicted NACHT family NTPase